MSFVRAGVVRPIRPLIVLVTVSLALVVGAQSALGAHIESKSGRRGAWSLLDTAVQPGVTCIYDLDGSNDLDRIEARSPRVRARNRSAQRDSQWVGIRIQFQQSKEDGGTGGWDTVKTTGFIKKLARDDLAVGIGPRAWNASYTGTPQFQVVANIRWYRPGTKSVVQGALKLVYRWIDDGDGTPANDRCLPEGV